VATTIDEHVAQLGAALADPQATRAQLTGFVASFIRPQGLDRPSTPLVADAIEEAAAAEVVGPPARGRRPLRAVLRVVALLLALGGESTRRRREARRELTLPLRRARRLLSLRP
jgi:hypothetical protein